MRLSQSWRQAGIRFDEENLVSCAGLGLVMRLAEGTGLHELVADAVQITDPPIPSTGVNPAGKITSIVAGMAAGADSIDDLDVLRHGGMPELFGGVYAPSTLGSFLRAFTWGAHPAVGCRHPGLAGSAGPGHTGSGRGRPDGLGGH